MADKYDKAITYLIEHPDEILKAWGYPTTAYGGCLFAFVTPGGGEDQDEELEECGCLTQVRAGFVACTTVLTAAIQADTRIPDRAAAIEPQHLPAFAEWQRKLDAMFPGRAAPEEGTP